MNMLRRIWRSWLWAWLLAAWLLGPGVSFQASAGGPGWQPLGPEGGPVYQLTPDHAAHPRVIYAAAGHLYRSRDGGIHWLPLPLDDENVSVRAVGVTPQEPTTLFVGLENAGVRMSMDGGATWHRTDLDNATVRGFVFHPENPRIVYAVTEWSVYRSVNRGWNWEILPLYEVKTVVIHPRNGNILYAGTNGGVYKSWDGGCTWRKIGLPGEDVWALAIDPKSPETIYAGTWMGKLYVSNDGGEVWIPTPLPYELPHSAIHTIVIDPTSPSSRLIIATPSGLWRSMNGGETWEAFGEALAPRRIHAFLAVADATFLAGTDMDIFRSEDGGATWQQRQLNPNAALAWLPMVLSPTNSE